MKEKTEEKLPNIICYYRIPNNKITTFYITFFILP